jgi:hypothetical protein
MVLTDDLEDDISRTNSTTTVTKKGTTSDARFPEVDRLGNTHLWTAQFEYIVLQKA